MSDTDAQAPGSARQQAEPQEAARPGLALAVLATCALMLVLDSTVVYVALPKIQQTLHMSGTSLVWVINAYALTFGGLMLLGGRAGDLVGQRRVFLVGIVIFGIGSLAAGLAGGGALLIAARTAQGLGAALAAPCSLALIPTNFADGPARAKAIGVYTGIAAAGGTLGLIIGGLLTDWASWRWVFFVNVPVVVAVVLLAPGAVRESVPRRGSFDVFGAITSAAAMVALVYGLIRTATEGWTDGLVLACLGAAAVLFAVFVVTELRTREPLLPLRLFADRVRASGFTTLLLFPAAFAGTFFFLTQYLQLLRGFSALRTGFAFLPTAVLVLVAALLTGQLVPRLGTTAVAGLGAALTAGGMLWLTRLDATDGYAAALLGPLLLEGVGAGLIYASLTASILSTVDPQEAGVASSVLQAVQQIGPAFGLAVLVTAAGAATDPVDGMRRAFWVAAILAATPAVLALIGGNRRPAPTPAEQQP